MFYLMQTKSFILFNGYDTIETSINGLYTRKAAAVKDCVHVLKNDIADEANLYRIDVALLNQYIDAGLIERLELVYSTDPEKNPVNQNNHQ